MNKIAHYLQEHISGEVVTSADIRRHFSTDGSIFTITPNVVVYPRSEDDIRKIARFTWQLAERGRIFPITARGAGTDLSGAAIGGGIVLVFPAHLSRILELDSKTGNVVVEPGINYGKLQQALLTHDRFLPPYPSSMNYSTIGGAISNNAGGDKSLKYGTTIDYVKSLRVVLANGEVIETRRLHKRELNKKLGLSSFEGELYRNIDQMLEENATIIDKLERHTTKNSSGYNLHLIKRKDNSFDLSPLFIGSQGTLGIITEATLTTEQRRPNSILIAALFDNLNIMGEIILELRKFQELPSSIELVDENLLKFAQAQNPNILKNVIKEPFPKFILLIEFDSMSEHVQKRLAKKTLKLLKHYQIPYQIESDALRKEELWKIRHSAVAVVSNNETDARPVPVIEDGIVPPVHLTKYIAALYELFEKNNLKVALYGSAGEGHLYLQPLFDLKQIGHRQKIFKIMDEYYRLVIAFGGSISAQHGDGRIRSPYVQALFGPEAYELFKRVKQVFDPFGILNPGVKLDNDPESLKKLLRDDYNLGHIYNYLPHA